MKQALPLLIIAIVPACTEPPDDFASDGGPSTAARALSNSVPPIYDAAVDMSLDVATECAAIDHIFVDGVRIRRFVECDSQSDTATAHAVDPCPECETSVEIRLGPHPSSTCEIPPAAQLEAPWLQAPVAVLDVGGKVFGPLDVTRTSTIITSVDLHDQVSVKTKAGYLPQGCQITISGQLASGSPGGGLQR